MNCSRIASIRSSIRPLQCVEINAISHEIKDCFLVFSEAKGKQTIAERT